jgi:oligopeptidase B
VETVHGESRLDPYYWLRERDRPEVHAYLQAENAWTEQGTRHTALLQQALYHELLGRIKEDDATVPVLDRGFWYYTRYERGKAYPLYCRRAGSPEAPEQIYLDQNLLAEGAAFHSLGGTEVSPDGRLLIYLEDTTASREYDLTVKDLESGRVLERLSSVWVGSAWAADSRSFFYVTADASKRGNQVWHHVLGTPREADTPVFREDDALNGVSLSRSRSGRFAFIASEGYSSGEWWAVPTADPGATPRLIAPRRAGVEYNVDHADGYFLLCTNADAPNFRVVRAPEADPRPARWEDWLPHREDVFVESVDAFQRHAVVCERVEGLRQLRIISYDGGSSATVAFPEPAYGVFPGTNPEFDTDVVRFTYSSLTTPPSVYDHHVVTGERVLRKRQEIPSGFDPTGYQVRRLQVQARDGARVPVSLLFRNCDADNGPYPLLLQGYGAYGVTVEPIFDSALLSLVDRGFVCAIAHVRGGQELGRRWYDDGKMLNKLNSFHDFIDVAEELVRQGYTSPDRLVANGGSAGGLLVGAVANMRPDLFRAIVAEVPFVDVINTMLDGSLPLTAQEWEQWGDPCNEDQYRYMMQYSPYDNVAPREYPWMLVTSSLNDSQVMYWEPAKWVARLRATKTDSQPLYLKTSMAGGHSGSSGRYDRLRERAFKFAFMLDAVGLAGD